ncbi:transcriptional regulator, PadR family [Sphingomonas guangdongensis]|uniref:Transcriptional regulator, PadR family n=1 Tax=Sphingomonas guangdongensis TaxID=1141890 RepID=A0A285QYZ7_9SPHN|nr:PadR family transcriptional regulator [Sphingomonas guangdongensis]SOB86794.1 transcriptional regulator, PadR family [Sphingomonas guangdongensis]
MFRFSHGPGRGCGPRGRGRPEMDVERFFEWVERLNEGGPGRGGGRRGRMFDGGELRLVLLKLIADEPRHGYDLIRAIEEMTGGAYAPSPGVVYPTLTLLGEMGHIEEQASEGAKKRYAATDAGRIHLTERAHEVEALIARLTAIGEHRNRSDHRPIRRAMGNLRFAVKSRMIDGLEGDTLHEIAAILDEAAQRIERL